MDYSTLTKEEMEPKTFDKIQELYAAIFALHPVMNMDKKKEERLYLALHDLKFELEKNGFKLFEKQ